VFAFVTFVVGQVRARYTANQFVLWVDLYILFERAVDFKSSRIKGLFSLRIAVSISGQILDNSRNLLQNVLEIDRLYLFYYRFAS